MLDARLNSVHLEAPRRQEFRAARDRLLNARGDHTLAAEARSAEANPVGHAPASAAKPRQLPPEVVE